MATPLDGDVVVVAAVVIDDDNILIQDINGYLFLLSATNCKEVFLRKAPGLVAVSVF